MKEIGSLLEFIKTGKIGKIQCGLTRQEVIEIIGEPEEWRSWGSPIDQEKNDSNWWSYGLFSTKFENDKIVLFGVYYTMQDYVRLPENFEISGLPCKGPSFNEFLSYINDNKLENMISVLLKAKGQSTERCIIFNSGVIVFGGLRGGIKSFRVQIEESTNPKHWVKVEDLRDLI